LFGCEVWGVVCGFSGDGHGVERGARGCIWVDELTSQEERSGTCEDGDVDRRGMRRLSGLS